ncbi:MAG: hypothetical protein WCK96_05360 [Methylococcales bacterium]
MNKVICNQCVTPFIYDVFSKKRLFFIKNHQPNKYNPLIYLYFIHAPTPKQSWIVHGLKKTTKSKRKLESWKELVSWENENKYN